jgi:RNA polymerase sigma-70 factor (ECF subfamily)
LQKQNEVLQIINSCIKGDRLAQKKLFDFYYPFAKRVCQRFAKNKDETEDLVAEGFIKVFNKLDKFDPSHAFEAWFRTVLIRNCIDFHRKYHSQVHTVDVYEQYNLESDDYLLEKISGDEILELIQKLPPSYKSAFVLYVVEGYSHAEIAQMLNINEVTSRSNLLKARTKLKFWINDLYGDPIKNSDHEQF